MSELLQEIEKVKEAKSTVQNLCKIYYEESEITQTMVLKTKDLLGHLEKMGKLDDYMFLLLELLKTTFPLQEIDYSMLDYPLREGKILLALTILKRMGDQDKKVIAHKGDIITRITQICFKQQFFEEISNLVDILRVNYLEIPTPVWTTIFNGCIENEKYDIYTDALFMLPLTHIDFILFWEPYLKHCAIKNNIQAGLQILTDGCIKFPGHPEQLSRLYQVFIGHILTLKIIHFDGYISVLDQLLKNNLAMPETLFQKMIENLYKFMECNPEIILNYIVGFKEIIGPRLLTNLNSYFLEEKKEGICMSIFNLAINGIFRNVGPNDIDLPSNLCKKLLLAQQMKIKLQKQIDGEKVDTRSNDIVSADEDYNPFDWKEFVLLDIEEEFKEQINIIVQQ